MKGKRGEKKRKKGGRKRVGMDGKEEGRKGGR